MTERRNADTQDATDAALAYIHDALDKSIQWEGRAVRHYEHVPEDATFPYFVSGPSDTTPDAVQSSTAYGGAQVVEIQLDTFSTYRGKKEVAQLQSLAIGKVSTAAPALDGGERLTLFGTPRTQIIEEPQAARATYHGIATLRLRLQLPPPTP